MTEAKHIGYDTTGRTDTSELPEILSAWSEFRNKFLDDDFAPKEQ